MIESENIPEDDDSDYIEPTGPAKLVPQGPIAESDQLSYALRAEVKYFYLTLVQFGIYSFKKDEALKEETTQLRLLMEGAKNQAVGYQSWIAAARLLRAKYDDLDIKLLLAPQSGFPDEVLQIEEMRKAADYVRKVILELVTRIEEDMELSGINEAVIEIRMRALRHELKILENPIDHSN